MLFPSMLRQRESRQQLQAEVAELADAHGSGPCTRKGVGVRVPSSAPKVLECVDAGDSPALSLPVHGFCPAGCPRVRLKKLMPAIQRTNLPSGRRLCIL